MIIDCHGHFTTAPKELQAFRDEQIEGLKHPEQPRSKRALTITDDQLREAVQPQLKFQSDRGTDVTIFSPRASAMAHHIGDLTTSTHWTEHCNDLIYRVCELFPKNFVGVCQLPQTPGVTPDSSIAELKRCVNELGLRGLQPQPGPVGRHVELAAAHRQALVSVLRGDGGAGRAGDGARQRVVQPQLSRHRRALPQRRHHGVHAVPHRGPVQGLPGAADDHPARRRRGAVPLGPLPRPGAGHEAAAAAGADEATTSSSTPASTTRPASTC